MIRNVLCAAFVGCATVAAVAAPQGTTTPPQTTPQTTPQTRSAGQQGQPMMLSGCVGNVAPGQSGTTGSGAANASANARGQQRYALNQLQWSGATGTQFDDWMKSNPRRAGAGAAGTTGTTGGTMTRPTELSLMTARGSNVDLSKYAGQNIEVTGTYDWGMGSGNAAAGASGSTGRSGNTGTMGTTGAQGSMQSQWPTFNVTSVRVISPTCK